MVGKLKGRNMDEEDLEKSISPHDSQETEREKARQDGASKLLP